MRRLAHFQLGCLLLSIATISSAGAAGRPDLDVALASQVAGIPVLLPPPATLAPAAPRAPGSPGSSRSACTSNADCDAEESCRKDPGDCDGVGTCFQRPVSCLNVFEPVCGCDGNTYANACFATLAGANVAFPGPC